MGRLARAWPQTVDCWFQLVAASQALLEPRRYRHTGSVPARQLMAVLATLNYLLALKHQNPHVRLVAKKKSGPGMAGSYASAILRK